MLWHVDTLGSDDVYDLVCSENGAPWPYSAAASETQKWFYNWSMPRWPHVTSFAATLALLACTNVLLLPPMQPQTLHLPRRFSGVSSNCLKRQNLHFHQARRPKWKSSHITFAPSSLRFGAALPFINTPFPPSSPPTSSLLSAFDHHADARRCSKEGLGFREARGVARYGALAVGVGLWYGCPTRLVVYRPVLCPPIGPLCLTLRVLAPGRSFLIDPCAQVDAPSRRELRPATGERRPMHCCVYVCASVCLCVVCCDVWRVTRSAVQERRRRGGVMLLR
jgi:hypothetical protein